MAEKEKKTKKNSENAVQRYFRETTGELRKVNWPTWAEAQRLTILVLVVMVVMGLFLTGVDYVADLLVGLALGL